MMAKVTDLNGCFVIAATKEESNLIIPAFCMTTEGVWGNMTEENGIYTHYFSNARDAKPSDCKKEVYFHDGEFYDCPAGAIPWTDGSIDEQDPDLDGVTMVGGEDALWRKFGSTVEFFANPDFEHSGIISGWIDGDELFVIGYRQVWGKVMAVVQNMRTQNCSAIHIECLRKPETEAEKKTRETAEEVNRICSDLFGTPAFDCDQAIIDTVEKMVINGYKKAE